MGDDDPALDIQRDTGKHGRRNTFTTRENHVQPKQQCDLCDEDHELNASALQDGSRILSAFKTTTSVKLWVITEAEDGNGHRTATTLLLPEEY